MSGLEVLLLLNTLLVVLLIGLVYLLARYIGDFIRKINSIRGLQIGSLMVDDFAPNFREFDSSGNKIISGQLYKTKRTLLLFVKSTCPTCKSILSDMARVQSHYNLNYVIINIDEISNDAPVLDLISDSAIYLKSNKLSHLFSISAVPHAILVNTDGKIDSLEDLKETRGLWNLLINEDTLVS